jgi:opacity protein-like surface antigen
MGILKNLAGSGALLVAMTGLAQAADMGAMPEIPVIDGGNAMEPELGTNWYLRGDIGYAATSVDVTVDLGGASTGKSDGSTWDGGLGVGYDFGWFRTDVTLDYLAKRDATIVTSNGLCVDGSVPLTGPCQNTHVGNVSAVPLMLNGYFDLGTWNSVTPYVGVGAGVALVSWDDWRSNSLITPETLPVIAPAINRATDDWRFAWSLMAGFSYSINQNLALDVSYRFLDITDGTALPNYRANPSSLGIGSVDYSDFYSHQVRVGFRYTID